MVAATTGSFATKSMLSSKVSSQYLLLCTPYKAFKNKSHSMFSQYLLVGLGKLALRVEGCNGRGKLGHGVDIGGKVVQQGDYVAGQLCPARPLRGKPAHLLLGRDLPSEQQPEEALGKRLLATGCFW